VGIEIYGLLEVDDNASAIFYTKNALVYGDNHFVSKMYSIRLSVSQLQWLKVAKSVGGKFGG